MFPRSPTPRAAAESTRVARTDGPLRDMVQRSREDQGGLGVTARSMLQFLDRHGAVLAKRIDGAFDQVSGFLQPKTGPVGNLANMAWGWVKGANHLMDVAPQAREVAKGVARFAASDLATKGRVIREACAAAVHETVQDVRDGNMQNLGETMFAITTIASGAGAAGRGAKALERMAHGAKAMAVAPGVVAVSVAPALEGTAARAARLAQSMAAGAGSLVPRTVHMDGGDLIERSTAKEMEYESKYHKEPTVRMRTSAGENGHRYIEVDGRENSPDLTELAKRDDVLEGSTRDGTRIFVTGPQVPALKQAYNAASAEMNRLGQQLYTQLAQAPLLKSSPEFKALNERLQKSTGWLDAKKAVEILEQRQNEFVAKTFGRTDAFNRPSSVLGVRNWSITVK